VIQRDDLVIFIDEYLTCAVFKDYAPNGLQIEGKSEIQRICTAVTASEEVITQAIDYKADALLVHHGYFWRGENPVITGMKRQRIGKLIAHDINLLAYHLPLDCHPILGNNACIAKRLEITNFTKHKAGNTPDLLWIGALSTPTSAEHLASKLNDIFKRAPLHLPGSEGQIQQIAWCSGAAQDYIEDAHRLGANAYISGEVSERTYYQAQELGIHYFACGHHATEREGINALGTWLSTELNLEHHFLDSDNPI
jgi:dinuclear metal center YbgI/SA1388 family protein